MQRKLSTALELELDRAHRSHLAAPIDKNNLRDRSAHGRQVGVTIEVDRLLELVRNGRPTLLIQYSTVLRLLVQLELFTH